MKPPQPFEAKHWLFQFREVGGYCWFPQLDDMHVGWQIEGRCARDHQKAKRLYDCVEYSDERERRWTAIEAIVKQEIEPRVRRASVH